MSHLKLAWVFVIMMVAVSAAMNFSFGWRLGEHSYTVTEHVHDGWIFGLLSLAGDGLKIAMGVLTVVCLTAKRMPIGLRTSGSVFCGFLFACATLYSLNSAIGSISLNRTDMAGVREAKATNYDAVKIQLDRVQKEQSWLDQGYRASAAVAADMAGLRQSSLWTRTAGCTNATVDESRSFCQRLSALQAELGTSKRAEDLGAKAETLSKQLAGMGGAVVADPHAKMLNQLTGYDQQTIVLGWLLLVVALVEGGSTLGPIALSMAYRALQVREDGRTALKSSPASIIPATPLPAVLTAPPAPRSPMVVMEKLTGVKAAAIDVRKDIGQTEPIAAQVSDNFDPTGPGTPIAKPEPKVEEVAEARNVVSFFRDNGQLPEAQRGKKKGHKPVAKAASWLADACTQVEGHREKSKDCWKSYQDYCATYGKKELPRNAFSRQLNVLVGQKSGKDRPRNKGGSTFEGIRINPVMAQARRRVA